MASTDQVKRLIDSHERGDEPAFRRAVRDAISEAHDANQDTLAFELESAAAQRAGRQRPLGVNSLRPLPTGRDDLPLVSVRSPRLKLRDMVLSEAQTDLFQSILREQANRELLLSRSLKPRTSLLFTGPSGTGKTRTAEALAGELGVPLVTVRLAAVVSSYLGETSRHLERVMEFAATGSWVLVFDEIDMLASERAREDQGEMRRVVASFLQTLEESESSNLVVATTNHAQMLDVALWRRFDEVSTFRLPNQEQVEQLLRVKLRRMKVRVNRRDVARAMSGMTPAQVEQACLDAMRRATIELRPTIETTDLIEAATSRRARYREALKSLSQAENSF